MAICTFVRSSSLNNFEFCQQQHFMTYTLGYTFPAGLKADKGSAVHKVMERLAEIKKELQDNPDTKYIFIGDKAFSVDELYKKRTLTENEILATNKARASKSIYKSDCSIELPHIRMGEEAVEELIKEASEYYSSKSVDKWSRADYRDVREWTWIILDCLDGEFDPRNQNIVSPEKSYDISLDYLDWSSYEYKISDEIIKGHLRIKGTIDLITEISKDTCQITDYKTGLRVDWATGNEKDYEYLKKDRQLQLYSWAVRKILPQYKNVLVTIFFVRDGGPFTVAFEPETDIEVENMLKEHFEAVKNTELPVLCHPKQLDFKCTKFCSFYKNNWPNSNKNMCQYIHDEINKKGIIKVIEEHKLEGHVFDKYQEPGQ